MPFFTFYIATVIAAALFVRFNLRASWGMFAAGVVWIFLADQIGGFIGAVGVGVTAPQSKNQFILYIPYLCAAVTEEIGRCIALYRYAKRQRTLADILMFAVGFGGFEVVYHGAFLLLSGVKLDYQTTLLMVEIYAFHIALSIIIFTYIRHGFIATTSAALIYHVSINIGAYFALQHSPVYAIVLWSVASAIHIPWAWRLTRVCARPATA